MSHGLPPQVEQRSGNWRPRDARSIREFAYVAARS